MTLWTALPNSDKQQATVSAALMFGGHETRTISHISSQSDILYFCSTAFCYDDHIQQIQSQVRTRQQV